MLAQIGATTSRIRLGTNVHLLPLRHPLVTARLVTTLDVLTGGRLSLGIGVGWLAEEFAAAGVDRVVALLWMRARDAGESLRRFAGEVLG